MSLKPGFVTRPPELRLEDPESPDFPDPASKRRSGVVFWPVGDDARYPLRVGSGAPCVTTWLWRPERFTQQQRAFVAEAEDAARHDGFRLDDRAREIRVAECEGLTVLEVTSSTGDEPLFTWRRR